MSKNPLDIMPNRELAAAAGRTEIAISTPASMPTVRIGGPINATLMRWKGQREAKTYRSLTESTRAQIDFVNARSDLARSMLAAAQTIAELRELPVILDHDAQVRQTYRDRDLANAQRELVEARYGLDATRDEIAELRSKQRKKMAVKEKPALKALVKAKMELEALGRDTAAVDEALAALDDGVAKP